MHSIVEGDKNYFFLFSGGLDSSYGLLKLLIEGKIKKPINLIFFNYGQFSEKYEWQAVEKVYDFLERYFDTNNILQKPFKIDLSSDLFTWTESVSFTGSIHKPKNNKFAETEIENRNIVLFSILYSYILSLINRQAISKCEIIIYTGLRDKELPDASSSFFYHLNEAMKEYHEDYPFSVKFIIDETPNEILEKLKRNILPLDRKKIVEFCKSVSSCYAPKDGKPCYECAKCKNVDSIIKFVFNKGRF